MSPEERGRVEAYLRKRLGATTLSIRARPRKTDSAEVYIGEEFVGVLSRDDEEGELSWHFTMSILEMDLDDDDE
ncbi:MAG: DUF3126 family protein [Alphaproteobacteria bacterium]|nr:DUF3126 family protein [Alphaproteobacteria bacterium]